jgi:tetratricopeptide (TPR) repeat protein
MRLRPLLTDRTFLGVALLLAVAFSAYWPCLDGEFLWDGKKVIPGNSLVTEPGRLLDIWMSREPEDYWPLTYTNFWLQWRLWGYYTLPYHVVSVLLHVLNGVLLWKIVERLQLPGGWLSALVFVIHPVAAESVAWIVQQKTLLPTTFALASLLHYIGYRNRGQSGVDYTALLFFALSLLSKTSAVALPLVLLGFDWWWGRGNFRRAVVRTAPFFVVAIALGLLAVWYQQPRGYPFPVRTDAFAGRLAGAGLVFWFYLRQDFFPAQLMFIYPRWEIDAANAVSYLPVVAAIGLLVIAWLNRRRCGLRILSGLECYLAALLPVLGFVTISFMRYSFVADHWQYMALAVVTACGVSMAASLSHARTVLQRRVGVAAASMIIVSLSLLTWNRSRVFHSELALWLDALSKNPDAAIVYSNLGTVSLERGRTDKAVRCFQTAVAIDPRDVHSQISLTLWHQRQGRVADAEKHIRAALDVYPRMSSWNTWLGTMLAEEGKTQEAIEYFQRAIDELPPDSEHAAKLRAIVQGLKNRE